MFSSFFAAAQQFANMFIVLFSAGEKFAKSIDNVAKVAEELSGQYSDQASVKRSMEAEEFAAQATEARAAIKARVAMSLAATTVKAVKAA